jgi:hypothetical protein
MAGASRSLTDLFSIFGGRRAPDADSSATSPSHPEPSYPTKALAKFVKLLSSRESPTLVDLGPVVGSNVTFFGEQLACRMRVEDLAADIDRHVKEDRLADLPKFFETRFAQPAESVDGILAWDVMDFLDRPAATALAQSLTRLLRPEGVLLGLFSTAEGRSQVYTKYVVVDQANLRYRTYPAARQRQRSLVNRDIIRLFEGLRVTESFLMKNNVREILFRKPAYLGRETPE